MVKRQVVEGIKKKWESGSIVSWLLSDDFYGHAVSLRPLKASDYQENIKQTINYLNEVKSAFNIDGIDIEYKEVKFRNMGQQRFPVKIHINTAEALLGLISKLSLYKLIEEKALAAKQLFPALFDEICRNPSLLMNNTDKWSEFLKVLQYFQNARHVKKYIRELDIQGVDSKFIEKNRKLIRWGLDIVLEDENINLDVTSGKHVFERRFHLNYEKPRVRFRVLDPALRHDFMGCEDIEIMVSDLVNIDYSMIDTVYFTENKTSGLTFPECRNSIVIFGLGYSVDILKDTPWLNDVNLVYWGDIDTHGFSILSRLRRYFPKAKSLMMDMDTFQKHKHLCVNETELSELGANHKLTADELLLFDLLSEKHTHLRLEQERLPFSFVEASLNLKSH